MRCNGRGTMAVPGMNSLVLRLPPEGISLHFDGRDVTAAHAWDEEICSLAAAEGHLSVLQSARQNGCSWDEETCCAAAEDGDLRVLQWVRQNGCPWNEKTCTTAATSGH